MLYLLPNLLDPESRDAELLPAALASIIPTLDGLIAESEKAGRRYLKLFPALKRPLQETPILLLNEHTDDGAAKSLLEPLKKGEIWGLVSDAGLPAIADPGATLVRLATGAGIPVRALLGPCSIIHALMLSGFSGQQFTFHGYLPKDREARQKKLKNMEKSALSEDYTQIFMEAPYRSHTLLAECLETLHESTRLAVAWDLDCPGERVIVAPVATWKTRTIPQIEKKPAIFLIGK